MATASGTGLLVVWTDIAPDAEAEFNEWYNSEHIPQLLGVTGFLSGKRYQAIDGKPKYSAIYELADENVMKSDAKIRRRGPARWCHCSATPSGQCSEKSFLTANAPRRMRNSS